MTASASPPSSSAPRSFGALRHPGFRRFIATFALAMMADNIEHVISYWVLFQRFHSAALGGFAVLSHWLPFLLFSVPAGALAERVDPRRLIQVGMLLFIGGSLGWGWAFATDRLTMPGAMLILIVHGCAGVLWQTSSQLLLHDIVPAADLQSAVRLNATGRQLGVLAGPAVGGALLLGLGPAHGILMNTLLYLPALIWFWRAPYGPRFRTEAAPAPRRAVRGIADIVQTVRDIGGRPVIVSMVILAGAASFFVGNGYQAQMPNFADDLGHGDPGAAYSLLLAADAGGALLAGLLLEGTGWMRPHPRLALGLAAAWCVVLTAFAFSHAYLAGLVLLFAAGFFELAFGSMAQTLVQLDAPAPIRGRVIGLFNMASLGMRTFSGITVGLIGALVGVHASLGGAALAMLALVGWLLWRQRRAMKAVPSG